MGVSGGCFEGFNLDPPIRTRGPMLYFSQFHYFHLNLAGKTFVVATLYRPSRKRR